MKVAFINSLYPPHATGGAEATLQGLAEGLVNRGWEAHVISLTPETRPHEAVAAGVRTYYEPSPTVMWPFDQRQPAWRKALFQVMEAYNPLAERRVRRLLQRIRPDVVHVHNFRGFSASVWRAAARLGLPVVQTLHDYTLTCPRGVMFKAGRNCQTQCASCALFSMPRRLTRRTPRTYTAVSRRMVQRMAAAGAFPARVEPLVIRGDNPSVPAPPRPAAPGAELVFGFLGRLDPMKGVEVLIAAASEEGLRDSSVLIGGAGRTDYEAGLRTSARSAPRVEFLGRVDPGDFFERIDVLVAPSVWEEPLGRVVHEALGYGRPVIASRVGGIPEIVRDSETGFLVAPSDAAALAEAMRRAKADPKAVRAMAPACLAAAEAFARPLILDQYEQALRSACGIRKPAGPATPHMTAA